MKSKLFLQESVDNKDRKFGSALTYYPCYIEGSTGDVVNALFTHDQIEDAISRAIVNPEDMPKTSLWEALLGK